MSISFKYQILGNVVCWLNKELYALKHEGLIAPQVRSGGCGHCFCFLPSPLFSPPPSPLPRPHVRAQDGASVKNLLEKGGRKTQSSSYRAVCSQNQSSLCPQLPESQMAGACCRSEEPSGVGVRRKRWQLHGGARGRVPQASPPLCQDEDGPFLPQLTPDPRSRVPLSKGG